MPRLSSYNQSTLPVLEQSLQSETVDILKWYADYLPGKTPTRKADLIAYVQQYMASRSNLRMLLDTMSAGQRLVVAEIVHSYEGEYRETALGAKYPAVQPPTRPTPYYGYYGFSGTRNSGKKIATAFDILFFYSYDFGRYIPADLSETLKGLLQLPPPAKMHSGPEPPVLVATPGSNRPLPQLWITQSEVSVFHDLLSVLSAAAEGKVAVSATTRLPTLPTVKQLRTRMLAGDYFEGDEYQRAEDAMRPFAWVMLAQAAGWIELAGSGSKVQLTKSGIALMSQPLDAQQIKLAWNAWTKSDLLDELSRVRSIRGQQSSGVRLTKPSERKGKFVSALRNCPPGRWVLFEELLRYIRAESLLPSIERNSPLLLVVGSYFDASEVRYWDVIIGSYLRTLLWEYIATLGIVDIAYTRPEESPHDFGTIYGLQHKYVSRYDGLVALRLTPLGAYVLGLSSSYAPPLPDAVSGPPVLRVLPNLDIVITDPLRLLPNERAFLGRIAAVESENVYRLSRDVLLDAAQSGLNIKMVRAFLASKSGIAEDDLPQTVHRFLSDLEKKLNAFREAGRMLVLACDDPYVLAEVQYAKALRGLVKVGKVDEQSVLLIPEEHETAARKHLKKLGYVPARG
ncbi:MAG: helicase-associated domain-containing protein [Chloroflexota bacterium]|nr:helicase-associated domain-containing protein [Chloroflexota bacterium]